MKKYNYLNKTILLLLVVLGGFLTKSQAQDQSSAKQSHDSLITEAVNAKHYRFTARTVSPMGGGVRQLTSIYDLKVSGDTLISNLPYFGRAYSAPMNPSEGGFNFTSEKFDYLLKKKRKGGWDISIKPIDAKEVQQMSLTIFENGSASLQVLSNNRQPISFNGYISALKE